MHFEFRGRARLEGEDVDLVVRRFLKIIGFVAFAFALPRHKWHMHYQQGTRSDPVSWLACGARDAFDKLLPVNDWDEVAPKAMCEICGCSRAACIMFWQCRFFKSAARELV